jgi:hypothetical protein
MGIPVDLFTPVFPMARVVSWIAHVLEEQFAGVRHLSLFFIALNQSILGIIVALMNAPIHHLRIVNQIKIGTRQQFN